MSPNLPEPYLPSEVPKKPVSDQEWRQASSKRFDTYEAAKEAYDASDADRKRVRRRANSKFDFVVYERLPKAKEKPSS